MLPELFSYLGLSAHIPRVLPGSHAVSSLHFRFPGTHGNVAQIFYPQANLSSSSSSKNNKDWYVRRSSIAGIASFASAPRFLLDLFLGRAPHPLAQNGAPFQCQGQREQFPVVIMLHGLGGTCDIYSCWCSFIASFGYVVLALESEDGSGSFAMTRDGGVVEYERPPKTLKYVRSEVVDFRRAFLLKRIEEVRRTLEFLHSHQIEKKEWEEENVLVRDVMSQCDVSKVFIAGHSFGAASSVAVARAFPPQTFRGAVLLDMWPFPLPDDAINEGIQLPTISILSEPFFHSGEHVYTRNILAASNRSVGFYMKGAIHQSFSDTPWWIPFTGIAKRAELRTDEDPLAIMNDIVRLCVVFLDACCAAGASPVNEVVRVSETIPRAVMCDGPASDLAIA